MAALRLCSIPDCGKRHLACGFCSKHYQRWKKNGDPLISGATAPGDAFAYFRDIVLNYDGNDCLLWPYGKSSHGYGVIGLDGRPAYVHRLTCELIHGAAPEEKNEVAHSCGRGHEGCVAKSHLRWASKRENAIDRIYHGTGRNRITDDDVRVIRNRDNTIEDLCRTYGLGKVQVYRIRSKQDWGWVD